jgi:CRP-like cAMP-binding protein
MELLSQPLRHEIFLFLYIDLLKLCPIFDEFFDFNFASQIVHHINTVSLSDTDTVFQGKEKSGALYFVKSGAIEIFHPETNFGFKVLEKDSYFGEIAFFTGLPRS